MKKSLITQGLKVLLFLSFGFSILYLLYRNQQKAYQAECAIQHISPEDCSLLDKVINDFANANYWWILVVMVAFMISNVSRAIRWKMLIKPLGYNPKLINCFWSVMIGYFANLGFPRMGDVVARTGTLAQYEKIGVEKVIGTVVVERMIDVIFILSVTALALLLAFNNIWPFFSKNMNLEEKFDGITTLLIIGGGVIVLGGVLGFIYRKSILESKFGKKIVGIILGFYEGIKTVGQLDKPWTFVAHSFIIWLMYYLMIYLCFFSYQPTAHLGLLTALVVFTFGAWGMVIPSPGGMGTYHFMVQTALSIYGISEPDSFSFANIAFFSIQIGCNVLFGILALIFMPIINRNYIPNKQTQL